MHSIRRNIAAVRSGKTPEVLPVAADAPMSPNYRTWTDRSGKNKVVAALVEVGDKDVVLHRVITRIWVESQVA